MLQSFQVLLKQIFFPGLKRKAFVVLPNLYIGTLYVKPLNFFFILMAVLRR